MSEQRVFVGRERQLSRVDRFLEDADRLFLGAEFLCARVKYCVVSPSEQ